MRDHPRRIVSAAVLELAFAVVWCVAPVATAQCGPLTFSPMDPGFGGSNDYAIALIGWDPDGSGPLPERLVVSGGFLSVGGVPANNIAEWDGTSWQPLGQGGTGGSNSPIRALAVYGGQLVAGSDTGFIGGLNQHAAAWNGSSWSSIGIGQSLAVDALAVYAGELVAGGYIFSAGGVPVSGIARWNGSTWQSLGSGLGGVPFPAVFSLAVFNGELVAHGVFTTAGGVPCNNIARWNGSSWAPLGAGISGGQVYRMKEFGGWLYVVGSFNQVDGMPANGMARWNGTSWQVMGNFGGPALFPVALEVYAGDLIVSGPFTSIDGIPINHIARWNGCWRQVGAGIGNAAGALGIYEGALIAAGNQLGSPGPGGHMVTRWRDPLSLSQPGGPGAGLMIRNDGLVPGHEYYNIASFEPCACTGSGPFGGLCATDLSFILSELAFPLNSHPFHFIATSPVLIVGPYAAPIGIPFDAITVDVTNASVCISPALRYTTQ